MKHSERTQSTHPYIHLPIPAINPPPVTLNVTAQDVIDQSGCAGNCDMKSTTIFRFRPASPAC
jgi:hypothetical protein